jgi:hypothetical protein
LPEISGYATNKNDRGALETEKTITSFMTALFDLERAAEKSLYCSAASIPLISLRMPKHSVRSRMLGLTMIDQVNLRARTAVDFTSPSLIELNRDSRTGYFFAEGRIF